MDPQATAEPRRAGTDHVTDTRHNHAIDLATESEAMASRNARPTRETQRLPLSVVIAAGIIAALQVGKVSIGLPAPRAALGMALGTACSLMGVFALICVVAGLPAGAAVNRFSATPLFVPGAALISL